jgi:hypothetical protein
MTMNDRQPAEGNLLPALCSQPLPFAPACSFSQSRRIFQGLANVAKITARTSAYESK